MKAYDYNAVVYNGDVFCVKCLPHNVEVGSEEVFPIFAYEEWVHAPICCECGEEHDYVTILEILEEEDESGLEV